MNKRRNTDVDISVKEIYGNRVRIRVCGICCVDNRMLLVNHRGLTAGNFWSPPGGGMEFGSSATENLTREFAEETGLVVEPGLFLFATEFIQEPLHALELFFAVTATGGDLRLGHDPEMGSTTQIIKEVRFLTFKEIDALPPEEKHGLFGLASASGRIGELNGYFRI